MTFKESSIGLAADFSPEYFGGQNRVGQYIQNTERKTLSIMKPLSCKTILQK